jgi:FtsP/CotA-like multicopper oxidase with cupredoxin domain
LLSASAKFTSPQSLELPALLALRFATFKRRRRDVLVEHGIVREKEAQNARADRAEIIRALSVGEISRGDFFRWGIFTAGGLLVCKSPFASSAFAQVLTGTPRSPLFGAPKFNQPMPRLNLQHPVPITRLNRSAATATFPWTIKINGQPPHSMNANRISLLIPKAGEIEHWTLVNGGAGCDHPIHLHFEEGVTLILPEGDPRLPVRV